jgi:transcriptional regulator with XRE-family HTH domain
MEISFAIWLLRNSRQMTQSQLADRMGTSRQQVSDLEIGQLPTIATLLRIARALQINPACLLLIAEARRRESVPLPRLLGHISFTSLSSIANEKVPTDSNFGLQSSETICTTEKPVALSPLSVPGY